MRLPVFCALSLAAVLLLASPARADRVALLPSGSEDPAATTPLDVDLTRALVALRHDVVPANDVAAAVQKSAADGVADTPDEYRAVGAITKADWVVVATTQPA